MRALLLSVLSIAILAGAYAIAAEPVEPVEIPLKEIWALDMPGTRDVRELDPRKAAEETMITKMGSALFRHGTRPEAGPCFVVKGEGKKALANAVNLIVAGDKPPESVPSGEDVSLVFYSHPAPGYVFLDSVQRSAGRLTLKYKVIVHQTTEVTSHFALIPLGKLDPGTFTVDVVEVDGGGPKYDSAEAKRAVCDSCSFMVRDGRTPE